MDKRVFLTGPEPTIKLMHNDVWLPNLYSRRVLCFELPEGSSHDNAIDVIERSLQALVSGTPELGGIAITTPTGAEHDPSLPWRAIVPGKGIEFVVKDLTASFASYKKLEKAGFPLSAFKDSILMPIDGPLKPEPAPQAKFQLNLIEGGVLLSSCIFHRLTDGNGMNAIMRALAEECKKAAETRGPLPPRVMETDRAIMNAANGSLTDLKHHPAYDWMHNVWMPGAHHEEAPPEVDGIAPPPPPQFQPHYYYLPHDKAQALKEYGSLNSPVSTHDAIVGALWRALIITRIKTGELKDLDQISTYSIPHNARKYLGLPNTWVGNCTYFISVSAKVSEIIAENSLPILASKIRSAMNAVTPEHVKSALTLRRQDPYSLNWWPIIKAGEPEVIGMTSFYQSELMDTDWGKCLGNQPKHFTCTDLGGFAEDFQRAHFVGPKLAAGRACYVHVGLLKTEVEYFRAEAVWKEYFEIQKEEIMEDE